MLLKRLKPDPIPKLNPVPEFAADEDLKVRYEEMKSALQVPWMGVVTMAYAHYRNFYDELWRGLKPLCESSDFVEATRSLRLFVEEEVASLAPQPIRGRLSELGYGPREMDAIKDMVEVFSHGNFPYLIIATITRMLLEGNELSGAKKAVESFSGRHAPDVTVPFVLMEMHHAGQPTKTVYEDIKTTIGLPFVNTDYRAFARWPSYFSMAWNDLRPHINTPQYDQLVKLVHEQAKSVVDALPNPGGLLSSSLRNAAQTDAPLDEVLGVAQLFQWLLPGLVTNVAFFRQQLTEQLQK